MLVGGNVNLTAVTKHQVWLVFDEIIHKLFLLSKTAPHLTKVGDKGQAAHLERSSTQFAIHMLYKVLTIVFSNSLLWNTCCANSVRMMKDDKGLIENDDGWSMTDGC